MRTGVERTIDAAAAEIAWRAIQASTLPEERTLAVDLIVDGLLEKIWRASAGAAASELQEWLDVTYAAHGDLPCLGGVLTATWRQVLEIGRSQGRLADTATLVAIGEIVEEAVRKPRASHVAASEPLDAVDAVISDLIARLFEKDVITGEHSRAVSSWCLRLARNLGLSAAETTLVRRGGLLHDIGKVGTPEEILNAPRKLTADEWDVMQRHTLDGAHIVADIPILDEFLPAIRSHHERLDGQGYPDGLRAEQIPLSARIVSVADCFNAMIGRRPYRPPMAPSRGIEELERSAGTHLDPEVVAAMIRVVSGQHREL
jgi:putative nucleotidyltransferase with HDIG domain